MNDLAPLAAAPPDALGGAPQWGLDLTHQVKWDAYQATVERLNDRMTALQGSNWNMARAFNASATFIFMPLLPLHLPFVAIVPDPTPAAPAAGNPAIVPPAVPNIPTTPNSHELFPNTQGALTALSGASLHTLLVDYQVPGYNPNATISVKMQLFASFIGVRL